MSVTTTAPAGASPRRRRRRPGSRIAYLYVLPFFVVFAAFSVYPWVQTAWLSLHKVELSTFKRKPMEWVGFQNYIDLFHDHFFWNAFWNTISLALISTIPQLLMALGIAHLLNYKLRGRTFFRISMLLPYATSLAAATIIFTELFDPHVGFIDWVLRSVHLHSVDWQNSKWPAQIAISSIVTWRWTGYNALIYLAGLQAVDQQLYEAAAIDGASRWKQFRYITLPSLRPTIIFTIVISTIGALQLFGEPKLYQPLAQPSGGSDNQYQTLSLLMYQQGFSYGHLGQASAIAWTMFIFIVIAVLVNLFLSRNRDKGGR